MKNNYFKQFHKNMANHDLLGAKKALEEGVQAYGDHMNQMIGSSIDGEEAGMMLAVLRPIVKALKGFDGAAAAEAFITRLFSLKVERIPYLDNEGGER